MLKFFAEKMWVAFAVQKLYTHIFSAKNIRILYIESAKPVNEMTHNKLIKLTMLWTTWPWIFRIFTLFIDCRNVKMRVTSGQLNVRTTMELH